jgi:hypothetical protein
MNRPGIPPLYNECIALRMRGSLNITALEQSFAKIIDRHEIWRTNYIVKNGNPVRVVRSAAEPVQLSPVDLRDFSSANQEEELLQVVGRLVRNPFDLGSGTLLRTLLIRLNSFEYRLYVVAHLSIIDGVSVYQVFPRELSALYSAQCAGRPCPLDRLSIQFGDYARWQRERWEREEFNKEVDYWCAQLEREIPRLNWPSDHPRPTTESFRGSIIPFALPPTLTEAVKALSRREGITLFTVLLAALATLLHSYTQQDDFTLGTPSPSGRKQSEVEKLVGYFLTPVTLRFQFTKHLTFCELLKRTHRLILEAISNDNIPIEVLADALKTKPDSSRNPLFDVALSLQPRMPQLEFDWTITSMDIGSGGAPWDLYVAFIESKEGMIGRAQYNPDIFEDATITRMIDDYEEVLGILTSNPLIPVSHITIEPH